MSEFELKKAMEIQHKETEAEERAVCVLDKFNYCDHFPEHLRSEGSTEARCISKWFNSSGGPTEGMLLHSNAENLTANFGEYRLDSAKSSKERGERESRFAYPEFRKGVRSTMDHKIFEHKLSRLNKGDAHAFMTPGGRFMAIRNHIGKHIRTCCNEAANKVRKLCKQDPNSDPRELVELALREFVGHIEQRLMQFPISRCPFCGSDNGEHLGLMGVQGFDDHMRILPEPDEDYTE